MIIRQFRESDAREVSELIVHCLKEINAKYYTDDVIEKLIEVHSPEEIVKRSKNQLVLVADQYDDIIGTATVKFSSNYFGSVFVHPDFQGRGIGKRLMENLEDLIAQNGRNMVEIHASLNAVEFYEKIGYERKSLIEDEDFGKSYLMIKKLNE